MYDLFIQPRYASYPQYRKFAEEHQFSFEILDFALNSVINSSAEWKYLSDFYRIELSSFKGNVTMHGPFMDILVHSPNQAIAGASQDLVKRSLDVARAIGANAVVFHTGFNPILRNPHYAPAWLKASQQFWAKMVDDYRIEILLENMWDQTPSMLNSLLQSLPSDQVNHCFDVGHHHVFGAESMESWISALGPRLNYIHLNDNHGYSDEELAAGQGTIDWNGFSRLIGGLTHKLRLVFEVHDLHAIQTTIDYLSTNHLFPFGS